MSALLTIIAVLLDAALGEPRRWHPLVGFGRWAQFFERRLNMRSADEGLSEGAGAGSRATALRLRGVLAVVLAISPWILLAIMAVAIPKLRFVTDITVLYLAIGHQSLRQHALRVHEALQTGNLNAARQRIAFMVSRDTGKMSGEAVAAATVESVLENGNDAVFAALFWFLLAGAPGVVLYRFSNTLDAMWGYRTQQYLYFGWAAARLDDVLNFIPARLTALTYASIGRTCNAMRCWRSQAGAWESPNAGPVMAAGAGALGLGLGGGAYYHGHWKERPPLGVGPAPTAASIPAALRLVRSGVVLWLLIVVAVEIVAYA
jgi:adenosylcobinamide-phosphate synthase